MNIFETGLFQLFVQLVIGAVFLFLIIAVIKVTAGKSKMTQMIPAVILGSLGLMFVFNPGWTVNTLSETARGLFSLVTGDIQELSNNGGDGGSTPAPEPAPAEGGSSN